jgi:hypothetical protein
MIALLTRLLRALWSLVRSQARLAAENIILHQQLIVVRKVPKRVR